MKKLLFLYLIFVGGVAIAQPSNFSIEQATLGQARTFAPQPLRNISWRGSLPVVTYLDKGNIAAVNVSNGDSTVVAVLSEVENEISKSIGAKFSIRKFGWKDSNILELMGDNAFVEYGVDSKQLSKKVVAPSAAENFTLSPNKTMSAYTVDDNLFMVDGDRQVPITVDGGKGIVNGKSVHRNEFGINGGIFWSPKNNAVAFYRMDESMVSEYPIVDITKRVAALRPERYPMAGMTSHQVKVGVFDIASGKTVFLETGAPFDRYFTNITWTPDGRYILVAELNRGQNQMKLNKYDSRNGMFVATLVEEKSDKWVEPQVAPRFLAKNQTLFIWESPRDGWNHLYLYNVNGKLVKQLTKGSWEVSNVEEVSADDKYIYYTSTEVNPLERHLYKLDIKTGKSIRLTDENGTHRPIISHSAGMFVDSYSNLHTPNVISVRSTEKSEAIRLLVSAKNPYVGYKMGEQNFVKMKTLDGKYDLYGRIILPADFDSTKKYPVIVYVYGGPHSQLVTDTWLGGARLWEFYMAQKGYVMFTMDNRGTAGRGNEFYQEIHRNLGVKEMEDQLQGIRYLKSLPYVDSSRIGVHGWSYGGFMTTSLMTKHPEIFKVGVAGAPVIDWKLYEVMYGERYMDQPQENPDGYANANLLSYAKDLKGDLLIIHSDYDVTVVWQNTLQFIRECVNSNVPIDYFIYPQHEHNVRGKDRVHLMTKITKYFDDNLLKK